jgi:hypothetical protein
MAAAVDDDEDFLHVLLRIQREGKLDPPLTDEDIKTVIVVSSSSLDPLYNHHSE